MKFALYKSAVEIALSLFAWYAYGWQGLLLSFFALWAFNVGLAWSKRDDDKTAFVERAYPRLKALQEAERELLEARLELKRLREVEHYSWHVMEAAEEHANTGMVIIAPLRDDYDRLVALLPESHPAEHA